VILAEEVGVVTGIYGEKVFKKSISGIRNSLGSPREDMQLREGGWRGGGNGWRRRGGRRRGAGRR